MSRNHLHPLLPLLLEKEILYIKVTLFPNYGIPISTTLHYAAVDCSSYSHFMKTWATISKLIDNTTLSLLCQPCFDCALIFKARGIGGLFIKDMEDLKIRRTLIVWSVRPTKVEFVSIEKARAFLLADNREVDNVIKVGIAFLLRKI
ncbi:hypothetical protein HPP92_020571 [Vanilla planifolia]|uniref:Uncharacterized protein n=1 Tax=Vanilla planifolia TaxID=51239 RepID=A0A835QAZ7_VANPL|nr:hypothetical protein HPP92_020571 [Vanilla planifolia]